MYRPNQRFGYIVSETKSTSVSTIHFWDNQGLDIIEDFKNQIEVLSDFEIHGEGTSNIKKRFEGLQEEKIFSFIDEIKNELEKRKKTATNKV